MIEKAKNKIIGEPQTTKSDLPLEEFHFAGGREYEPLTVHARSREEAEEIWMRERKKVESNQIIE
jgi:hypothetical protein